MLNWHSSCCRELVRRANARPCSALQQDRSLPQEQPAIIAVPRADQLRSRMPARHKYLLPALPEGIQSSISLQVRAPPRADARALCSGWSRSRDSMIIMNDMHEQ
eukprot:3012297-Prymnesium_polylepis.1